MSSKNGLVERLVTLLTFGSIFLIMLFWLFASRNSILGLYSLSITGFLTLMYAATAGYEPEEDSGFRPEITVIIPAKNEGEVIESVLRTVFSCDYPSAKMRVIAVDDGSTDQTWDRMERVKADPLLSGRLELIRHEKNYGKRVALASAIERAHADIVVCMDSDSFVNTDAIRL